MVLPGISQLLGRSRELLGYQRIGLVSNTSAILPDRTRSIDALWAAEDIQLVALYAPEHGLAVDVGPGIPVASTVYGTTGVVVHSLYGRSRRPSPAMLDNVDLLVFDIQTVGARFYTYVTTLRYVLEAAAERRLPIIVCDRPNPIGGILTEGPILDHPFESFVGPGRFPIRYGLTIGELARLYVEDCNIRAELTVIPCVGWRRDMWFDETGLPWVAPSPNLPRLESVIFYPGTCLFEGTNLSEGRGTPHPFQMIGAPWVQERPLADALNHLNLPGVQFHPVQFTPQNSKWAGKRCSGVKLHLTDREQLRPVSVALYLLAALQALHPHEFAFQPTQFDRLAGTDEVRFQLSRGVPVADIIAGWQPSLDAFNNRRTKVFIYD